jgi:hypothetical protein
MNVNLPALLPSLNVIQEEECNQHPVMVPSQHAPMGMLHLVYHVHELV